MQIMNVAMYQRNPNLSCVCVLRKARTESPRNEGDERRITVGTSCTTKNVESSIRRGVGGIYLFKDLAFCVFQQWMS